jgi:hypothetical protein
MSTCHECGMKTPGGNTCPYCGTRQQSELEKTFRLAYAIIFFVFVAVCISIIYGILASVMSFLGF